MSASVLRRIFARCCRSCSSQSLTCCCSEVSSRGAAVGGDPDCADSSGARACSTRRSHLPHTVVRFAVISAATAAAEATSIELGKTRPHIVCRPRSGSGRCHASWCKAHWEYLSSRMAYPNSAGTPGLSSVASRASFIDEKQSSVSRDNAIALILVSARYPRCRSSSDLANDFPLTCDSSNFLTDLIDELSHRSGQFLGADPCVATDPGVLAIRVPGRGGPARWSV